MNLFVSRPPGDVLEIIVAAGAILLLFCSASLVVSQTTLGDNVVYVGPGAMARANNDAPSNSGCTLFTGSAYRLNATFGTAWMLHRLSIWSNQLYTGSHYFSVGVFRPTSDGGYVVQPDGMFRPPVSTPGINVLELHWQMRAGDVIGVCGRHNTYDTAPPPVPGATDPAPYKVLQFDPLSARLPVLPDDIWLQGSVVVPPSVLVASEAVYAFQLDVTPPLSSADTFQLFGAGILPRCPVFLMMTIRRVQYSRMTQRCACREGKDGWCSGERERHT
jgi:hypothetical protein